MKHVHKNLNIYSGIFMATNVAEAHVIYVMTAANSASLYKMINL